MKIGQSKGQTLKPKPILGDNLLMGKVTTQDINIIDKSLMFNKNLYPMILPNLGTIGFFIKKMGLTPADIIEILKYHTEKVRNRLSLNKKQKFLQHILDVWEHLDNFSKQRFDLFDHLGKRTTLGISEIWEIILEGLSKHAELSTRAAMVLLELNKIEVISKVGAKVGTSDKADTLMAEMTGLKKNETNINVQQNQNQINLNERPTFNRISSEVNKVLMEEVKEDRLLIEGKKEDYIDVDIINEEKREVA